MKVRGRRHQHPQQAGMASIVISMMTMVVISLIIVGFATISRREQRNSLDQVQSTQAFYAAESGVDDARSAIRDFLAAHPDQPIPARTSCTTNDADGAIYPTGDEMIVDQTYNVSYSCLRVDPAPDALKFDGVGQDPVVVPISTPQPITTVEITWKPTSQPANPPSTCPAVPAAPTDNVFAPQSGANAWKCGYGVIKLDAVTTGNGGAVSRAGLVGSQLDAYFLPTKGNPSGDIKYNSSTGQANIVPVNCNAASGTYGSCTATVSNINGNVRSMALRISSIYQPSVVTIRALTGGNPQPISGVQASVDVTGKAGDTLRRIEVRLPLIRSNSLVPGQPLTSAGSVCKRLNVADGYFNIPGDIVDADGGNGMCQPMTSGVLPAKACQSNNDLAFVIDHSGSMSDDWNGNVSRMDQTKTLAETFIQQADIGAATNHAALIEFNDTVKLDVGLTGDTAPLLSAINAIQPVDGTDYLPPLNMAAGELAGARGRAASPKVIVFMSDGAPFDDKDQIRATTDALKAQGIRIYTIGIGDVAGPEDPIDVQLLTDMAGNGGYYTDARNSNALQAALKSISDYLNCN